MRGVGHEEVASPVISLVLLADCSQQETSVQRSYEHTRFVFNVEENSGEQRDHRLSLYIGQDNLDL